MNGNERAMLEILKRGRDEFGVTAVKAEFESEGTRPDEFLRLIDLARRADLKIALKIGGCEAVSDLMSSKLYGVEYIIAPMVETPYALSKFIEAKNKVYGIGDSDTAFLFNLETETTLRNLDAMVVQAKGNVDGIVFGRVDFTLSRGLDRGAINEDAITEAVLKVAERCRTEDLELVVGGSVAIDALPMLRAFRSIRLDRFETRKIVFDGSFATHRRAKDGLINAVTFECAWLKNKRAYYQEIASEDDARIRMLEKRLVSVQAA